MWQRPACITMSPEQLLQQIAEQQAVNTQAIADLNQAVNFLVTEALRPTVQQSSANYEQLGRIESIVESLADRLEDTRTLIASNAEQLATTQQLQTTNAQQIAANTEAITAIDQRLIAFDSRLEETRALVAENGSQIAQMRQQQANSQQQLDQIGQQQANSQQQLDQMGARVDDLIVRSERSLEETEALKELTRSQLAGIIGNGRRIDRLEQQAS